MPKSKGKAAVAHCTPAPDPVLERAGTYKLLLLNCPNGITTDDVMSYYRRQLGKDAVERVKWFFNPCGTFIGSGLLLFTSFSLGATWNRRNACGAPPPPNACGAPPPPPPARPQLTHSGPRNIWPHLICAAVQQVKQ